MGPPPNIRRIRSFRRWAPLFEVLDHESGPTSVLVVAAGSFVLAGLALAEEHPVRDHVTGLTLVAFLALTTLGAALVMVAGEAGAWLLARQMGRDLARAAASLEHARIALARVCPTAALDDAGLAACAERIGRATGNLERRLADADAAVVACGALREPACRASRVGLLLAEGRAIAAAAEALDGASHLLRWISACPWSPHRAEALTRLARDLAAAERRATGRA